MYQRSRKSMGEAKTALIGSGDFAEQVADLGRESEIEVVGMFDGNRPKGSLVAGIPVLGNDDDVEPMFKDGVFDAIFICIGYARFDLKQKKCLWQQSSILQQSSTLLPV